jgi:dTDP-4-dehydrorhamnose 3,5-epimerase
MEFTATQIPDVIVIDPVVYEDTRGFFMETWQEQKFRDAGIDAKFVQDSHSRSSYGALRGLHYQVSQASTSGSRHRRSDSGWARCCPPGTAN